MCPWVEIKGATFGLQGGYRGLKGGGYRGYTESQRGVQIEVLLNRLWTSGNNIFHRESGVGLRGLMEDDAPCSLSDHIWVFSSL